MRGADAQLQNEGGYYLNLTSTGAYSNCQKIDSIYIGVQLLQGLNTYTYTSLAELNAMLQQYNDFCRVYLNAYARYNR